MRTCSNPNAAWVTLTNDGDRTTVAFSDVCTSGAGIDGISVSGILGRACDAPLDECGVEFEDLGTAQVFTLHPTPQTPAARFSERGSADRVYRGRRRGSDGADPGLDGMVESSNGRSTWTYHPDDGLTIVCK